MSDKASRENSRSGRWGDRESVILDAAWKLISSRGFVNATMADVAKEVGLSEGSLYNYFSSKKVLGIRLAERWFTSQAENLALTLGAISVPKERLRLIIYQHLADILQEPELYLMWIRELRATPDYGDSNTRDIFRAYTNLLKDLLRNTRARGELSTDLGDDLIRDIIYGGVEHIAWTRIVQQRQDHFDLAETARRLADNYWFMIAGPRLEQGAVAVGQSVGADDNLSAQLARIEAKLDRLKP